MSVCVIKDCPEEANHHIHNPTTGDAAMICDTHVVLIDGYEPPKTEEE